MRLFWLLLVSATALFSTARADIACTPGKPLEEQHRPNMKRRAPPQNVKALPTTVAEMAEWPIPGILAQKRRFRKQDSPLDPREQQAYTVEGNLWRLKLEEEDCDFHLEVSVPGGTKKDIRIVAEIPQAPAFTAARDQLLRGFKAARELTPGQRVTVKGSVQVRLTGYAFCDAQHYTAAQPKRGKSHGTQFVATLWEIHPVWKIEFPDKKASPQAIPRTGKAGSAHPAMLNCQAYAQAGRLAPAAHYPLSDCSRGGRTPQAGFASDRRSVSRRLPGALPSGIRPGGI